MADDLNDELEQVALACFTRQEIYEASSAVSLKRIADSLEELLITYKNTVEAYR